MQIIICQQHIIFSPRYLKMLLFIHELGARIIAGQIAQTNILEGYLSSQFIKITFSGLWIRRSAWRSRRVSRPDSTACGAARRSTQRPCDAMMYYATGNVTQQLDSFYVLASLCPKVYCSVLVDVMTCSVDVSRDDALRVVWCVPRRCTILGGMLRRVMWRCNNNNKPLSQTRFGPYHRHLYTKMIKQKGNEKTNNVTIMQYVICGALLLCVPLQCVA